MFFLLVLVVTGVNGASLETAGQPAEFVGSSQCGECHAKAYADWQQSDHRKAMQVASKHTVLGNFDNVTVKFHNIETRLFLQDGIYRVETAGDSGIPDVYTIKYTFGHYPLQQYLVDTGNGHLQALNIAWDSRPVEQGGQRWYHLQAEEEINPEHPFFWTRHFQNANSRCIECHSTNVSKSFNQKSNSYDTTWSQIGVGCESCHGPAGRHLELAKADRLEDDDSGFARLIKKRLSWEFRGTDDIASAAGSIDQSFVDTCGGCHSRRESIGDVKPLIAYHDQYRLALLNQGLYFSDGQINDEVFVLGSFLQSKMQQRGVTCENCHDVHSGKLIAEGNALCAQCHKSAAFDNKDHSRHQAGSAGALCVNCHMPERLYMGVDMRRDHSFSIPRPQLSAGSGAPNACINCHQDKSNNWVVERMTSWGIRKTQNDWAITNQGLEQQDSLTFKDYAQSSAGARLTPIRQATLISKLVAFPSRLAVDTVSRELTNSNPLVRRAAVSALQVMPSQLRWQLLNSLIDDPVKVIRLEVANTLADALPELQGKEAQTLGKLIEEYRESLEYNADTPGGQLAIGNLELRLGYSILAERAYRKALDIEPHFVPALINLADLYRAIGSDGESRELLQRALELAPDSANSHHAYGLFLVRSGKQSTALNFFKTAIDKEDSNPRHVYVYAVALDSLGQTDAAIKMIEQQSTRWPNNLELSFLQVTYMEKTGNTEGIHRYLSLLATIAANNPRVRDWMRKYGG